MKHSFLDHEYWRNEWAKANNGRANPFANDMFTSAYPPNGEWKTYYPLGEIPAGHVHVKGNLVAPAGWQLRQKFGPLKGCKPILKMKFNPYRYFHVTGFETINFEMVC